MVHVSYTATDIIVTSPYHPLFRKAAHKLSGSHKEGKWCFDVKSKNSVLESLKTVFGYTEEGKDDLVDLIIKVDSRSDLKSSQSIFIAGRCIARSFGSHNEVKLGDQIEVIQGSFTGIGSSKNPIIESSYGVQFVIHNLYRVAAENADEMDGALSCMDFTIQEVCESTPGHINDQSSESVKLAKENLLALRAQRDSINDMISKQEQLLDLLMR